MAAKTNQPNQPPQQPDQQPLGINPYGGPALSEEELADQFKTSLRETYGPPVYDELVAEGLIVIDPRTGREVELDEPLPRPKRGPRQRRQGQGQGGRRRGRASE